MDQDVVPPKRVVLVVDVATFANEPGAARLSCLNAAARCISSCYVLNTEVEWGFMFIDTRVLPTAYGKRVLDICAHSGESFSWNLCNGYTLITQQGFQIQVHLISI
jgi:hypothetical protein